MLYKDPKTQHLFPDMTTEKYDSYFIKTMGEIDGLNALLFYPKELCSIMAILEEALLETKKDPFNYSYYRKLVLDAHGIVDRIYQKVGEDSD